MTETVRWSSTKEGVENFASLCMALQYGVLVSCLGCDHLARVVVLDDRAKAIAGYECAHCGATFVKRSKFTYTDIRATP
jgi:transposase-like protein